MNELRRKIMKKEFSCQGTGFLKLLTTVFLLYSGTSSADVMNLNNFMPTQLEDATPIDAGTMDVQYSTAFERQSDKVIVHRPNLRYGWSEKLQLETQGTIYSGGSEDQSGETDFNLLYRFNESTTQFPEISLTPMISFPTGKRMDDLDYGMRLNLTSTVRGTTEFPVTQIHLNYFIEHNNGARKNEVPDLNTFIFGVSQRMGENSSIIADGVLSQDLTGKDSYLVEIGLHHHLGKDYYLGLSASLGVGASDIKQMETLALEKQFN